MIDLSCYQGQRVIVTGSRGFKGGHLITRLKALGAETFGFCTPEDDIRSLGHIRQYVVAVRPHFLFHLAAQAFVPVGYDRPIETFDANAFGTLNVLEALRHNDAPCAVVIVTSDKVYGPCAFPVIERAPLVPHCPYSMSKVAAEHAVEAYRESYFTRKDHEIAVATARAGNVIGGGDYGVGRLVPAAVRALRKGHPVPVYNPKAVRPWQYVTDVIDGYLILGAALFAGRGHYAEAWNFGPDESRTVLEVVEHVIAEWGSGTWELTPSTLREVSELRINSHKARDRLGWAPLVSFEDGIRRAIGWYKAHP